MTPTDPNAPPAPGESPLAFSIIFFCLALLTLMLGWAQGVRKDTTVMGIPESSHWLIATAILAGIGVIFFIWSRVAKRS
ncbi:MAG TPA: hypothetical protein VHW03_05915 [Chthoniobacterales bacterium]|jgi:uncharacterized membrane protein|nr:hypothetical protein [Chthoniobacterales bacterium]